MHLLLLLLSFCVPHAVLGQFGGFEDFKPGSYVLTESPTVRHVGMLKHNYSQLTVQQFRAKNLNLTLDQVSSFQIEGKKFTVVGGFEIRYNFERHLVDRIFLEQLDSGQVELMRYDYPSSPNGAPPLPSIYVMRRGNTIATVPGNGFYGGSQKFREALLPHLIGRPDLEKLVVEKRVTADDMPDIIRALNTGKSFRALDLSTPVVK